MKSWNEIKEELKNKKRLSSANDTENAKTSISVDGVWLADGHIEVDRVAMGFQNPGAFYDAIEVEVLVKEVTGSSDEEAEQNLINAIKKNYPATDSIGINIM